ncbi:hypothetical protein HRbin12_01119 [bacterium HR12]|nr:hypothetical protein HRbin12_01119 [bacterium HR12]
MIRTRARGLVGIMIPARLCRRGRSGRDGERDGSV